VTEVLDPADLFDLRFVRDARLSPDGRRVVCAISSIDRTESTETCALWVIDLGSGETRLLGAQDGHAGTPRWSPDGSLIAYVEVAAGASSLMIISARRAGRRTAGGWWWRPVRPRRRTGR
jgi:Tol biopolymer transport system component